MTSLVLISLLCLGLTGAVGQQHPSAAAVPIAGPSAASAHHACIAEERAALERGEGFGMAMAAEENGYPGPKHVLDRKAELKLSADQLAAMNALFARMKEQAIAKGREVLAAEDRLGQMFAQKRSQAELQEQTRRIESLRAELRWTHLSAHLAAREILTPQQLAAYRHRSMP